MGQQTKITAKKSPQKYQRIPRRRHLAALHCTVCNVSGSTHNTCMRLCAKNGMLVAEKSASILRQGSCCSFSSISMVIALPSNASSASYSMPARKNIRLPILCGLQVIYDQTKGGRRP